MKKTLPILLAALLLLLLPVSQAAGIPMESSPGQRGSHVLALQQALIAGNYLAGEATGVYTQATARAVAAFQEERGLTATGRADRDTLYLLFTKPPPAPNEPQFINWYGGGDALIPMGGEFEMKDVRTGITFNAYRMMGVSHLDAEPLTQEDTRLMKEAYGGTWSWDRRPVLVRYQGQVYAASMNGMPHGYNVNKQNGMGGHFCIHFPFSRGDASQRVDVEHLNAAFEAYLSTWEDGGE